MLYSKSSLLIGGRGKREEGREEGEMKITQERRERGGEGGGGGDSLLQVVPLSSCPETAFSVRDWRLPTQVPPEMQDSL